MVNQQGRAWTVMLVKQAIVELNRADQPISLRSIGLYKRTVPDPIVSNVVGRPTSRKLLYEMACNHFGSWDQAIKACPLPPRRRAHNRFWNRERVIDSIRALLKDGHPMNVGNIWRDRSGATSKVLLKVTGQQTTGAGLHDAARRYFGSWDNALDHAGIPVPAIKEKTFWTPEKITASIQGLHKNGIALNSASVDTINNPRAREIIRDLLGKERHTKSLFGAACRTFGCWDQALNEAGLNPDNIRRNKFHWNTRSVSKVVKLLHRSGVPLNSANISRDSSEHTREIIHSLAGRKINGSRLYRLGRKKLGSWDATLKYSGFYVSTIRKRSKSCERNQERLIEIIRSLLTHEFSLNVSAITTQSRRLRLFNEVNFDHDVSGYSLMSAAKSIFSSWNEALWEAGLDPSEICLRSPSRTSNLPIMSTQVEDVLLPDGERRRGTFIGDAPKSPEQIIVEEQTAHAVKAAMEGLEDEDHELMELVFDEVLKVHHYRDQSQLIEFVVKALGGGVTKERIAGLFAKMAQNLSA